MTGRYFAVFATDKPDMAATRERVRQAHRAYLRAPDKPVVVRLGGPTLSPDGMRMIGTLLVVEAESQAEVERFLDGDPYVRNGVFEQVLIRPWQWGLGNPDQRV
ncbi:YciI family protein [Cupriavidus basilensis]|uniref:YciI family protein n=1 Tax=Cupriavidus basilensis TaxID=68895 RepID=A0ABT6AQG5_9BURK|nr:YciI family protein [Cupriavidus basilensis]MDF3834537.1 YciI family protein [Cupriavidus basilensis]